MRWPFRRKARPGRPVRAQSGPFGVPLPHAPSLWLSVPTPVDENDLTTVTVLEEHIHATTDYPQLIADIRERAEREIAEERVRDEPQPDLSVPPRETYWGDSGSSSSTDSGGYGGSSDSGGYSSGPSSSDASW